MAPFKSKAQARKIAQLEKEGKLPKGTFNEWSLATPSMRDLPERKSKKTKLKRTGLVKVLK